MGYLEQKFAASAERDRQAKLKPEPISTFARMVEVCRDGKCGGCLECLLAQTSHIADREIKLRVELANSQEYRIGKKWLENSAIEEWFPMSAEQIKKLEALRLACSEFVHNVRSKNVEGAGEMPLLCDESFRQMTVTLKEIN